MQPVDLALNSPYRPTQLAAQKAKVEAMAETMKNGAFDWSKVDFPIEVRQASNGEFIVDGHHRYLAARLAGVAIPPTAIIVMTQNTEQPVWYEWADVFWE